MSMMLFAPATVQGGQSYGGAYLPIWGKHKLLLVFDPAAEVSFLTMTKLINHTAFKAGIFLLLLFFLLLDLISSRLVF